MAIDLINSQAPVGDKPNHRWPIIHHVFFVHLPDLFSTGVLFPMLAALKSACKCGCLARQILLQICFLQAAAAAGSNPPGWRQV